MQEIETVEIHCKRFDCVYRGALSSGIPYCRYILETDHSRGCSISDCDKYKPKRTRKPTINKEAQIKWKMVEEEE